MMELCRMPCCGIPLSPGRLVRRCRTVTAPETLMAEPKRQPATATLKVAPDLLHKTKVIAAHEGGKVADIIDKLLRGPIEARYDRLMKRLQYGEKEAGQ